MKYCLVKTEKVSSQSFEWPASHTPHYFYHLTCFSRSSTLASSSSRHSIQPSCRFPRIVLPVPCTSADNMKLEKYKSKITSPSLLEILNSSTFFYYHSSNFLGGRVLCTYALIAMHLYTYVHGHEPSFNDQYTTCPNV